MRTPSHIEAPISDAVILRTLEKTLAKQPYVHTEGNPGFIDSIFGDYPWQQNAREAKFAIPLEILTDPDNELLQVDMFQQLLKKPDAGGHTLTVYHHRYFSKKYPIGRSIFLMRKLFGLIPYPSLYRESVHYGFKIRAFYQPDERAVSLKLPYWYYEVSSANFFDDGSNSFKVEYDRCEYPHYKEDGRTFYVGSSSGQQKTTYDVNGMLWLLQRVTNIAF